MITVYINIICPSLYHIKSDRTFRELEGGVDELKEMVRDVNETVVSEKDILSYSVYHYDKENGITIAA